HFRLPPFAKNAKGGAPRCRDDAGGIKSPGPPPAQTATTTYAHPRCGQSAEDGASRVPLPRGRTPRPFAVRVPRGPHSTPPTVRAGPTPTVAGCPRAAPERHPPQGPHLAARTQALRPYGLIPPR